MFLTVYSQKLKKNHKKRVSYVKLPKNALFLQEIIPEKFSN